MNSNDLCRFNLADLRQQVKKSDCNIHGYAAMSKKELVDSITQVTEVTNSDFIEKMLNNLDFCHLKKCELQEYLIDVKKHTPSVVRNCKRNELVEMITRTPSTTNSNSLNDVGITAQEVLDTLKMQRAGMKKAQWGNILDVCVHELKVPSDYDTWRRAIMPLLEHAGVDVDSISEEVGTALHDFFKNYNAEQPVDNQRVIDARSSFFEAAKELEVEKDKLDSIQKRLEDAKIAFKKAENLACETSLPVIKGQVLNEASDDEIEESPPPDDSLDNSVDGVDDLSITSDLATPVNQSDNANRPATFVFPDYQIRYAKLVFEIGIDSFCSFAGCKGQAVKSLQRVYGCNITVEDTDDGLYKGDSFSLSFTDYHLLKMPDYHPDGDKLFQQREIAWLELRKFLTPNIAFIDSFVKDDFPIADWNWADGEGSAEELLIFANYHAPKIHSMIMEWVVFSSEDVINGYHELELKFTADFILSLFLICEGYKPPESKFDPRCSIGYQDWLEQWSGHEAGDDATSEIELPPPNDDSLDNSQVVIIQPTTDEDTHELDDTSPQHDGETATDEDLAGLPFADDKKRVLMRFSHEKIVSVLKKIGWPLVHQGLNKEELIDYILIMESQKDGVVDQLLSACKFEAESPSTDTSSESPHVGNELDLLEQLEKEQRERLAEAQQKFNSAQYEYLTSRFSQVLANPDSFK